MVRSADFLEKDACKVNCGSEHKNQLSVLSEWHEQHNLKRVFVDQRAFVKNADLSRNS